MELRRDLISHAIIRTDMIRKSPTFEEDGKCIDYGRAFIINPLEINEVTKAIKATCEKADMPISRIYISGFGLGSKNDIWSVKKIINYFEEEIKAIKEYEEKNTNTLIKKMR